MTKAFRAIFQVAERVTVGNVVKTVACPTRLKLSKSANFNRILIKFKPPNRGPVVRKQFNANPGLKVNLGFHFPCLKLFSKACF